MHEDIYRTHWKDRASNLDNAKQLGEMLEQLFDQTQADHEIILQDILDAIYCEGDSFEATLPVIPFLLKFATQVQDNEIFTLLVTFSQLIRDVQEALRVIKGKGKSNIIELYKTLLSGIPLYRDWLGRPCREVRMLSAYVLSHCASAISNQPMNIETDLISPLKQCYTTEKDTVVRFTLIKALTSLQGLHEDELFTLFEATRNVLERLALSLAIVTITPTKVVLEIEQILYDFLLPQENVQLEDAYSLVPYIYDVIEDILQSLNKLERDRGISFLCNALTQWNHTLVRKEEKPEDSTILSTVEKLFELAEFVRGGELAENKRGKDGSYIYHYRMFRGASAIKEPPTSLSVHQKQALQALLGCELFWQINTNLLQVYALPTERQSLDIYWKTHSQ
jgi:hypothetical protein